MRSAKIPTASCPRACTREECTPLGRVCCTASPDEACGHTPRATHGFLSEHTECLPACGCASGRTRTYSTQVHNKSRLFVLSSKLAFLRTSSSSRPFKSESAIPPNKAPNRRLFCDENFSSTLCWAARRRPRAGGSQPKHKYRPQQARAAVRWRRGRSIGRRRRSGAEGSAGVTKSKARVRLLSCPQQASRSHNQRSHSVQFHASSLITSGCQLRLQGGQHPSHVSHPFPNSACRQP